MIILDAEKEMITGEDRGFDSAHASTLIQLENGDILAAWFGGSWEKGADVSIWMARRTADGWQEPFIIARTRGVALWNPVLFRRQDGDILLLFYKEGQTIQGWRTMLRISSDGGKTWTPPRELVPGDTGGRGPVKNKPISLSDGTILAPASLEGDTWDAFADISHDGGETWEMSGFVPLRRVGFQEQMVDRPYDKHFCFGKGVIQPTLWESAPGVVHMLLRSTTSRIFRSDSTDGGHTWCTGYSSGLPNNNSGIDLVKLKDGTLVLAYNPTENLPNYYKGPRTPLILISSQDNGETWKALYTLENGQGGFAYPAIICNDEAQELYVTYTWKRERIAFWRLSYT